MPGLRLLACFAHPDDQAFPVGGVLAQNVAAGRQVRLVTTTLGEEGEIRQEGSATRETLGEIRRIELACAVRALRLESHTLLDYRDAGMTLDAVLRAEPECARALALRKRVPAEFG